MSAEAVIIVVGAAVAVVALLVLLGIKAELVRLAERAGQAEAGQTDLRRELEAVRTAVAAAGQTAGSLADATKGLQGKVEQAQGDLAGISAFLEARRTIEERTAEAVRRVEAVIAGSASKGSAGESVLAAVLAQLPAEWRVENLRVGNKVVEFGLKLPDGLVLPIDSKWTTSGLIEQYETSEDPAARERLRREIEGAVLAKARELRKYRDLNVTAGFGLAVVPDAVYDASAGAHVEIGTLDVVIVPYRLFLPYLLLVFQSMLKASRQVDERRLAAFLSGAQAGLAAIQEELDGRLADAIKRLSNARDEMKGHVGKMSGDLNAVRVAPDAPVPR